MQHLLDLLRQLNASEVAAWWGAGVATLVFVWNLITAWRSGPRVKVRVSTDWHMRPSTEPEDPPYIHVRVINNGDQTTTIEALVGRYYSSRLARWLRKKNQQFSVPTPVGCTIPHELAPGTRWTALALQESILADVPHRGLVYIGVAHSQAKRPVLKKVEIPPASN